MELNFSTPVEELMPKTIEWNYSEFLTEVKNVIAKYEGLIYEEKQIAEAKEDRARLRNYIKSIDTARKQVKSLMLNPYTTFEQQIKEVTNLIGNAVDGIDVQVKAYEEKNKQIKREEIEQIYCNIFGSLAEYVPLAKIWDDRWLNVSVKLTTIEETLTKKKESIISDMSAISSLKSENEADLLAFYFDTFSVAMTIAKNNEFKEKRELAQKVLAKETPKKAVVEHKSKDVNTVAEAVANDSHAEKIGTITLKFTAPLSKLVALRKFVDENEIEYTKI